MQKNDNGVDIKDEDLKEDDFSQEEIESDATDWKAKAMELKGIAKRRATQLAKAKEKLASAKTETIVEPDKKSKPSDFDYGQKAYLKASGISSEEFVMVKEAMESTGKSLDEVLDSKWFKAELKDKRDAEAVDKATPSNSKRAAPASRDTVEYWIAKGELPPADQTDLRRKVVNARISKEKEGNKFSSTPVVGN